MPQSSDILIPQVRYTRADFIALKACLLGVSVSEIANRYYTEDDLATLGCQDEMGLRRRLDELRDQLIQRATDANPGVAEALRSARRLKVWSPKLSDFLLKAADRKESAPRRADPISAWMKPLVAAALKEDGIRSIGDLVDTISRRGTIWWRPIPRLGEKKAARLMDWLKQFEETLGSIQSSVPATVLEGELVLLEPANPQLVPLERISLPERLDGSQGINRATSYCLVSARNDLEAVQCFLEKFIGQAAAHRAYRKELERYLLWSALIQQKALSGQTTSDCEAYKRFLAAIPDTWIGPAKSRNARDWKPFAGQLGSKSQKYAVTIIRSFFNWALKVRYLAGNPWATVAAPKVATPLKPIMVHKALPESLYEKLIAESGILDQLGRVPDSEYRVRYKLRGSAAKLSVAAQFRLVRAALLIMGDTGLRREEVVFATRDKLRPSPGMEDELWDMAVLGKGAKWRQVYLPQRDIEALTAHWRDRGLDFSDGLAEVPLLSPIVTPNTQDAQAKHMTGDGIRRETGFHPSSLYRVIKTALSRIAEDETLTLTDTERQALRAVTPHGFRHTYGTVMASKEVALEVIRDTMGHASIDTTSIYIRAPEERARAEVRKRFAKGTN